MTQDPTPDGADREPTCTRADCDRAAAFWLYDPDDGGWRRRCRRHLRQRHPSLEVHAWLLSGYASPVELGRPSDPPTAPREGRAAAFRELVDRTMDW